MDTTIKTSADAGELYGALAAAKLGMGRVIKGKRADAGRRGSYTYADLASALEACEHALADAGVCIIQGLSTTDATYTDGGKQVQGTKVLVTTRLGHSSGQWVECTVEGWPTMDGVQGIGSTVTYLRRYSLMAMVGLAPEDDDGQAAQRGQQRRRKPPSRPPQEQQEQQEAYPDQMMRQACAHALTLGWSEEQVAGCLRYYGSTNGKVSTLPPASQSEARQHCWAQLQGAPPVNGGDDGANTPLGDLRDAVADAIAGERWTAREVAMLVTWGVARMTKGEQPTVIADVPQSMTGPLIGTLAMPYQDWARTINTDRLSDAMDDMSAQRAAEVLA